jgi:asparagine synthase (glutamine-hydrolysing)
MCGIVGILGELGARRPDPLGDALGSLAARGPDGAGRDVSRLGARRLELGARRLALVDPAHGRQPVVRPSGARLVFNGEVYNHAALRQELVRQGEVFTSRSDGEVLAALLDREGLAGLARVEGSYAFAFLKGPEGPLLLGRDPRGVRPLVFARRPLGLAFASTVDGLRALLGGGLAPDLDALADVLRDGVVNGTRTALLGVERVPPGRVLAVDAGLGLTWHDVPPRAPADGASSDVLAALRGAVADRLRLDRPLALFLSGGVDSALVGALAVETRPIPAYTLTFPGHGAADEARRAQRTAQRLGLEHVLVPCPADPTPWVLGAAHAFDEPFADASAVPTWGLARAAGAAVRAALTGTGGDEVFGGYRRYWLLGAGPWLRHVPAFLREPVSQVLARTLPEGARLLRAAGDPQGFYRGLLRVQPERDLRALLGERFATLPELTGGVGPRTAREAMADDLARYLPDDLLVKEDRALLAHGVEGRHPFLDSRVMAAADRLELAGSPGRGRQKQVLRAFVREVVDPDLARSAKRGFAFPVDTLYRGPLRPLAEEMLCSPRSRARGFLAPAGARALLRDHLTGARNAGPVIHAFVMLELWSRRVLDDTSLAPFSGVSGGPHLA